MSNAEAFANAAALASKDIPIVVVWGTHEDGSCACPRGKDCPSPGKHPVGNAWQKAATCDESVLEERIGDADGPRNYGILLGPDSGIIDVEFDGERGAETAERLGLMRCGTPAFKSSRSTHFLFKYDERLPLKAAMPDVQGLEVRLGADGRGAQSIGPGSRHYSGAVYQWHAGHHIDEMNPQPLPENLFDLIVNHGSAAAPSGTDLTVVDAKVEHGGRHDAVRRLAMQLAGVAREGLSHREQNTIFTACMSINSTHCNPPLPEAEVRTLMQSAFTVIHKARTESKNTDMIALEEDFVERWKQVDAGAIPSAAVINTPHENTLISSGLELRDDGWHPGRWRMKIIAGPPKSYRLLVPYYDRRRGREEVAEVRLDATTINKPDAVAAAILDATGTLDVQPYPGAFTPVWTGLKATKKQEAVTGVKTRLICGATEHAPEDVTWSSEAAAMHDVVSCADPDYPAELPEMSGEPVWVGEELVFRWSSVKDCVLGRSRGSTDEGFDLMREACVDVLGNTLTRRKMDAAGGAKAQFEVVTKDGVAKLLEFLGDL